MSSRSLTRSLTRWLHSSSHAVSKWPGWDIVIGIETHLQLKTKQKLFSQSKVPRPNQDTNTAICAFDIALPGTLPRLNMCCVELAIRAALALNATCQGASTFDRKHYFYPDLAAGYQITQHYRPFATGGRLDVNDNLTVRIKQIQLEQDTAKTTHDGHVADVDFNRAGCALLEIVTEPDIRSANEAATYIKALQRLFRALGVSDGNMENGSLRCDVNVSVNKQGAPLGTRCEIKNMNSLKAIAQAIAYEASRHIEVLDGGGKIDQETRGFDVDRLETFTLRSKEGAADYRYMPDSNLPTLWITPESIATVRSIMPETPEQIKRRLLNIGLSENQTMVLLNAEFSSDGLAEDNFHQGVIEFFDKVSIARDPQLVANWIANELLGQLSFRNLTFNRNPLQVGQLSGILDLLKDKFITVTSARSLLRHFLDTPSNKNVIDEARDMDLLEITDSVEALCNSAIESHPSEAAAVRSGNLGPLNRLVGQVMRLSSGKADASDARQTLLRLLQV